MTELLRYFWKVICIIAQRFLQEKYTYRASALTYTTLLSLVPLMTVMVAILSAFPAFAEYRQQIQDSIFSNLVPASSEVIQQHLMNFSAQSNHLSGIGIGMLIVTAVMLLLTIENSLNSIWRVKKGRSGVSALLRYWAVLSLSPIFIGLSFVVSSYLFSLPLISNAASFWNIKHYFVSILPFFLTFFGFTFLYIVVPNCKVNTRAGLVGGLVAALLFEGAKRGFALYIINFPSYKLIYGAFATIPIFLVWIYLSWLIILFGALATHTLATVKRVGNTPLIDGLTHGFLWINLLWQAQKKGQELTLYDLLKKSPARYVEDPETVLATLVAAEIIKITESGGFVLARQCEYFTLKDLFEKLPWPLPSVDMLTQLECNELAAYVHVIANAQKSLHTTLCVTLKELYEKNS